MLDINVFRLILLLLKIIAFQFLNLSADLFLVYSQRLDDIEGFQKIVMHLFYGFYYHKLLLFVVRVMVNLDAYYIML